MGWPPNGLAEPGVHLVEAEPRGGEVRGGIKAQPVEQVLVLLVPWIRQYLEVRAQPFRGAVPDVIRSFDLRRP